MTIERVHFHLFHTYARTNNVAPVNDDCEGWVSDFVSEINRWRAGHCKRELKAFFDRESIGETMNWRRRLGQGIGESRLLLASLSCSCLSLARQSLVGCHTLLDQAIQGRMAVDPPMRQLHAQLAPLLTPAPPET